MAVWDLSGSTLFQPENPFLNFAAERVLSTSGSGEPKGYNQSKANTLRGQRAEYGACPSRN